MILPVRGATTAASKHTFRTCI